MLTTDRLFLDGLRRRIFEEVHEGGVEEVDHGHPIQHVAKAYVVNQRGRGYRT